jgi:ribosomal-protein-alanine N-acetyltransferase
MLVGEDAHVVTLAVAPGYRERGVASGIMMELIGLARANGARHLTLEVRESNQAALELYRKFGFEPAGTRKGYYTTEDAVVMWAVDIDSVDYQVTLASIRKEAS